MLSYLAGVAAYVEAGGPAASQRPVNQQTERQAAARAHSSASSKPDASVIISFSSEALQAAKERSMADNMVEVGTQSTHAEQQDQARGSYESGLRTTREMSAEEQRELRDLERRDMEVRTRDMAFLAAAGGAAGSYSLHYETGPDGQRYVVGADISLDTSEGATPEQTLAKARALRAATLSAGRDSAQDAMTASKAMRMEAEARAEIERQRSADGALAGVDRPGRELTLPEVDLPELDLGTGRADLGLDGALAKEREVANEAVAEMERQRSAARVAAEFERAKPELSIPEVDLPELDLGSGRSLIGLDGRAEVQIEGLGDAAMDAAAETDAPTE